MKAQAVRKAEVVHIEEKPSKVVPFVRPMVRMAKSKAVRASIDRVFTRHASAFQRLA